MQPSSGLKNGGLVVNHELGHHVLLYANDKAGRNIVHTDKYTVRAEAPRHRFLFHVRNPKYNAPNQLRTPAAMMQCKNPLIKSSREPKASRKLKAPSSCLELELTSPSSPSLLEEELLASRPLSKRTPMERLTLLFWVVRVIAPVEPRAQFRIAKDLVSLVDACHFLFRFFFRDAFG